MPVEIRMPALSPTMETGKLSRWLVKEGDSVASGDLLAEIETDKATIEFEAVDEGTITSLVVPEGTEGVKVGAVIAMLSGEDEAPASAAPPKAEAPAAPAPEAKAAAPAPAAAKPVPAKPVPAMAKTAGKGERIVASPLARRFAAEMLPLFDTGALRPVIDSVVPVADIGAAHERLAANASVGKIVLAF